MAVTVLFLLVLSLLRAGALRFEFPANAALKDGKPIPPSPFFTAQHDVEHTNVVLGWTPRAGCTFVMDIWFRFIGCYDAAIAYHPFLHEYRTKILQSNPHGGIASLEDLKGGDNFKFKIVMDPYHRAVTMFEIMSCCINQTKSFIDFLHYLGDLSRHDRFYDGSFQDIVAQDHFRPQVALVENDANLYDVICKIENMEECLRNVNSRTGFNFTLPPPGSASTGHSNEHVHFTGEIANVECATLRQTGKKPRSEDFYHGESGRYAATLVQTLYTFDFTSYGYDRSTPIHLSAETADLYDQLSLSYANEPLEWIREAANVSAP